MTWPDAKVLVTGATGFVGSAVARRLLARGAQVRVLTRQGSNRRNIKDLAVQVAVGWLDNNADTANYRRGDSVVVSVKHCYDFLFFPATIPVVSSADMSLEQTEQTTTNLPGQPALPSC